MHDTWVFGMLSTTRFYSCFMLLISSQHINVLVMAQQLRAMCDDVLLSVGGGGEDPLEVRPN